MPIQHNGPIPAVDEVTMTEGVDGPLLFQFKTMMQYCPIPDLIMYGSDDDPNAEVAAIFEVRRRVTALIGCHLRDVDEFMHVLEITRSLIGGEFVTSLVDPLRLEDGDRILTVFTPNSAFLQMVTHINFEQQTLRMSEYTQPSHLPPNSYTDVCDFHSDGGIVRVVQSATSHAAWPILHYSSTHLMNCISATRLTICYPSWTFKRRGVQRLGHTDAYNDSTFTVSSVSQLSGKLCRRTPACGRNRRNLQDLLVSFVDWSSRTDNGEQITEAGIGWTLGGEACNTDCEDTWPTVELLP